MFAWFDSDRKDRSMMRPITARFRVCSNDYTSKPCGWDMITIKKLGEGGVYFHHVDKIDVGVKLELSIALPHKGTWAHCTARVCQVDSPSKDEKRRIPVYGVAANFTGLDEENYSAIQEAVEMYSAE